METIKTKAIREKMKELRKLGYSYGEIGRLQTPPISRQRVHQIIQGYSNLDKRRKIKLRKSIENKQCFICASDVLLQIHHIDGNSQNNVDQNLVMLCKRCHIKVDVLRRAEHKYQNNGEI